MKIPNQLKNQRFCRILKGKKAPSESAWTMLESEWEQQSDGRWQNKETKKYKTIQKKIKGTNKTETIEYKGDVHNYTYQQISKFFPAENYGVLTGINSLAVSDDDSPNQTLIKLYEENFKPTFRVRDHNYFYLKGWDGKKIIFNDKEKHLGELQGLGQQVVGAGSLHPLGEHYEIKNNLPIIEIDFKDFISVFGKYLQKKETKIIRDYTPKKINSDNLLDKIKSSVSMEAILSHFGVDTSINPTNCIFHSCSQRCLSFNSETCNCFDTDCGRGYNIFSFVQKVKGLDSHESIKWLCEFAGLQKEFEESKRQFLESQTQNLQPQGWALSINIKKMAERRNLLNCPNCNKPFNFNERMGWYSCSCGLKGGIKKLIQLNSNQEQK